MTSATHGYDVSLFPFLSRTEIIIGGKVLTFIGFPNNARVECMARVNEYSGVAALCCHFMKDNLRPPAGQGFINFPPNGEGKINERYLEETRLNCVISVLG